MSKWEEYKKTKFKTPEGKRASQGYKLAMMKKAEAEKKIVEIWDALYEVLNENFTDDKGRWVINKDNRKEIVQQVAEKTGFGEKKIEEVFIKFRAVMIAQGDPHMKKLMQARGISELFWGLAEASEVKNFKAHRGYTRDLLDIAGMFPQKGIPKAPPGASKSLTIYQDGDETGIIATGSPGEGIDLVRKVIMGDQNEPIPEDYRLEEKKEEVKIEVKEPQTEEVKNDNV